MAMAEKKDKSEKGGEVESNPQLDAKREKKKSRWTLALCKKYARRFHSVEEWRIGSPSCFKAAEARGWIKECAALMVPSAKSAKVKAAKAAKPSKPVAKPATKKSSKVS